MQAREKYENMKQFIHEQIRENLEQENIYLNDFSSNEVSENILYFCAIMESELLSFYHKCLKYKDTDEVWEAFKAVATTAASAVSVISAASIISHTAPTSKCDQLITLIGIPTTIATAYFGAKSVDNAITLKNAANIFLSHAKDEGEMQKIVSYLIIQLVYRLENLINELTMTENGVGRLALFLSGNIKAMILQKQYHFNSQEEFVGYLCKDSIPNNVAVYNNMKIEFKEKSKDRKLSSQNRRLQGALLEAHAVTESGNIYIKENIPAPFRYPPHKLINHEDANILGFKEFFVFQKENFCKNIEKIDILSLSQRKDIFSLSQDELNRLYNIRRTIDRKFADIKHYKKEKYLRYLILSCKEFLDLLINNFLKGNLNINNFITEANPIIIFMIAYIKKESHSLYQKIEDSKKIFKNDIHNQLKNILDHFYMRYEYLNKQCQIYIDNMINLNTFRAASEKCSSTSENFFPVEIGSDLSNEIPTNLQKSELRNRKTSQKQSLTYFSPKLNAKPQYYQIEKNKIRKLGEIALGFFNPKNIVESVNKLSNWTGLSRKVCWAFYAVGGILTTACAAAITISSGGTLISVIAIDLTYLTCSSRIINNLRDAYISYSRSNQQASENVFSNQIKFEEKVQDENLTEDQLEDMDKFKRTTHNILSLGHSFKIEKKSNSLLINFVQNDKDFPKKLLGKLANYLIEQLEEINLEKDYSLVTKRNIFTIENISPSNFDSVNDILRRAAGKNWHPGLFQKKENINLTTNNESEECIAKCSIM